MRPTDVTSPAYPTNRSPPIALRILLSFITAVILLNIMTKDYRTETTLHLRASGLDDEEVTKIVGETREERVKKVSDAASKSLQLQSDVSDMKSALAALTKIANYQRNYGGDEFGHKFPFPNLEPEEERAITIAEGWGGNSLERGENNKGTNRMGEDGREGHEHVNEPQQPNSIPPPY